MMRNGKNIALILTGMVLGTTLTGGAVAAGLVAEPTWNPIFVDGVQVEMEAYRIGGHNYVKLRDIGEKVGFNVYWDDGVQVDSDAAYTGVKPDEERSTAEKVESNQVQVEPAPTETTVDVDELRYEMVQLVNDIRRENGLTELTVNQSLMAAAQECSGGLYTSHKNRVECESVATHGYPHGFGSNLAVLVGTAPTRIPEKAVSNWENSPGHYQTMIDPDCDSIGVGITIDNGRAFCYMFAGNPNSYNPYS